VSHAITTAWNAMVVRKINARNVQLDPFCTMVIVNKAAINVKKF